MNLHYGLVIISYKKPALMIIHMHMKMKMRSHGILLDDIEAPFSYFFDL